MDGSCPGSGHGLVTVQAKRCWLSSVLSTGPGGGKRTFHFVLFSFQGPGWAPLIKILFFVKHILSSAEFGSDEENESCPGLSNSYSQQNSHFQMVLGLGRRPIWVGKRPIVVG